MNIRSIRRICVVVFIFALPLGAQEPQTEAGARASVVASLIAQNRIKDTARVVADIAQLKDRFVRCHVETGVAICAIADEKPVTMLSVKLTGADRAAVSMQTYVTMRKRCPIGETIYPPILGSTEGQAWNIQYKDGKWIPLGPGRGWAC